MAVANQSPHSWDGFDQHLASLSRNTVSVLRDLAETIERDAHTHVGLRSQERKADVVDKIQIALRRLRSANMLLQWVTIRDHLDASTRRDLNYRYGGAPMQPTSQPMFGGVPAYHPNAYYQNPNSYRPAQPAPAHRPPPTLLDWRATPMWRPVRALSHVEPLPHISANEPSNTRREQRASFMLNPNDLKLISQGHSVRLFCTSSLYYRPDETLRNTDNVHITNSAIPMDFPVTPDVTFEGMPILIKDKGLRNKAGSAPPLDLNAHRRIGVPKQYTITMRHSGPSANPRKKEDSKQFWYQVVLVEWTTKDQLLARIDALPITPSAESLRATERARNDSDDIQVVGQTKMTLKDPLSFMRMSRPIRSRKCRHQQCFDATWWVETNYTHPQWLCPNCSQELQFADLIMDGYTLDIQNAVGEDIDEVEIEVNGDWHTKDGKFGSLSWLTENGTRPPTPPPPPSRSSSPEKKGKRKAIQILSSDDEDGPLSRTSRVSVSRSNTAGPSRPPVSRQTSDVIDLTLSDDDDDYTPDFRLPGAGRGRTADGSLPRLPPLHHPYAGAGQEGASGTLPSHPALTNQRPFAHNVQDGASTTPTNTPPRPILPSTMTNGSVSGGYADKGNMAARKEGDFRQLAPLPRRDYDGFVGLPPLPPMRDPALDDWAGLLDESLPPSPTNDFPTLLRDQSPGRGSAETEVWGPMD